MRILVCVKQVPDNERIATNPDTGLIDRSSASGVINPYDTYALELALRLKDEHGGRVTALSMGPQAAAEALRTALAMGADEAVLLCDAKFGGADTLATSRALAAAARFLGVFDLIVCGKQATDGDTAQVGPGLAERLGLPQITGALTARIENGELTALRDADGGAETVACALPCLVTAGKPFHPVRLPTLKGRLAARRAEVAALTASDLGVDAAQAGLAGSPTRVVRVYEPPRHGQARMALGTAAEQAEEILRLIGGNQHE